jgi:small subunit ribosomal protein S20
MPIIKSAQKRMRQTAKRRARNQTTKRSLRAEVKALMAAVEVKDGKKASELLKKVQSNLDKAVKKNVLKKNTAARKLAQLTNKVSAIGAKPTPSTKAKATPAKKPAVTTKKAAEAPAKKAAAKKAPTKKPVAKKTTTKK